MTAASIEIKVPVSYHAAIIWLKLSGPADRVWISCGNLARHRGRDRRDHVMRPKLFEEVCVNYIISTMSYDFNIGMIIANLQRSNPFASLILSFKKDLPKDISSEKINEFLALSVRDELKVVQDFGLK